MCSGCSGRFEEDDEHDLEQGDTASQGSAGAVQAGLTAPQALDDYEVWVSCERIVERQVMRAKGPLFSEKGDSVAGSTGTVPRLGVQQSQTESARYYQELKPRESRDITGHDVVIDPTRQGSFKWRRWWWLAVIGLATATLWLATR